MYFVKRVCKLMGAGVVVGAGAFVLAAPALAQLSDDVVRIGMMSDQTGPYSGNGGPGSTIAARLAIEDFGGKVLGKNIELVVADDQNKPGVGINTARKWIEEDKFDAIIGGFATSIALGIQPFMKEKKKPYLIAGTMSVDMTGKACSPMSINFITDTYALAKAGVQAMMNQGHKTFYLITVDYAFGKAYQDDATKFIEANGGKVIGSVKHPLGTTDFSSYLLQAQASGAQAIMLLNAGQDLINGLKQAKEYRVAKDGKAVGVLGLTINVVTGLGLDVAQGLHFATPFYWDRDSDSRSFSQRFMARSGGSIPTFIQAGSYTAMTHYLKAVQAAGTDDGPTVMAKMKSTPVSDLLVKNATIREDGMIMRPNYSVEVKSPADSKNKNDLYKVVGVIPPEQLYRPLAEGGCELVKTK